MENIEIGLEFSDVGIGRGFADRCPRGLDLEPRGGSGEPGKDAGYRQAIGLAAAMRRLVGRALGQRAQILGDIGQMRRERQLGAKHMQFVKVETNDPAGLHLQRAAHHFGGHERIAVAVAADPASHLQEGCQLALGAPLALVQAIFEPAMQPGNLIQEGVVVERQAVGDLVEHGEPGAAQQVGLP